MNEGLMVTIPLDKYNEMVGKIYDYDALMRYIYQVQDERIADVNSSIYRHDKEACKEIELDSAFVDILTGSDLLRQIERKFIEKEEPAATDSPS